VGTLPSVEPVAPRVASWPKTSSSRSPSARAPKSPARAGPWNSGRTRSRATSPPAAHDIRRRNLVGPNHGRPAEANPSAEASPSGRGWVTSSSPAGGRTRCYRWPPAHWS